MAARSIRVRGVVQGVGFRPFVYRLACANSLTGWVLNQPHGVDIHLEGGEPALDAFLSRLRTEAPAASRITEIDVESAEQTGAADFIIRESTHNGLPTVRISPDLPVCEDCLRELFDPADPRYLYPYINCTNCGPRYTVIERLPYDRPFTTMKQWAMDKYCEYQYYDPADRRFHAQPTACPNCGPRYVLEPPAELGAIEAAAQLLNEGRILAVKGIGGYHLACDANCAAAVTALRERKFRKEKPFAVMARNLDVAREIVELSPEAEALLVSAARPIVLAPAKVDLPGVSADNRELGVMLPYAPLHYLLFAAGAPELLVMTSANRSTEPIAYEDDDARRRLAGLADAFLIGERPIARRVDDSVARVGALGPVILRRSRGYAPGAVATLPTNHPILAVGADLKNSITLVVGGQAFVSQHIGDLDHYEALTAFEQTIEDLLSMYQVARDDLHVIHDLHPQYVSTTHAAALTAALHSGVQHHCAHIASVLAEREAYDERVIGVSFDGTGYGDDGTIWGGEFFVGSLNEGFRRIMHLRSAQLPGGDAAARYPVQCAAGFLSQIEKLPNFADPPFNFPNRYHLAQRLLEKRVRTFETTSVGRLFDACAALLGFAREITFEGQAAIWLEQIAQSVQTSREYPFPIDSSTLDFRPLLAAVLEDRLRGRNPSEIARAFHKGLARGLSEAASQLCDEHGTNTVVLSGGVFQNDLLLTELKPLLRRGQIWTNASVPPNDGGISLGQAALAAGQAWACIKCET